MIGILFLIGVFQVTMSNIIAPHSIKAIGLVFYRSANMSEEQRMLWLDALGDMIRLWGIVSWSGYTIIAISIILFLRYRSASKAIKQKDSSLS